MGREFTVRMEDVEPDAKKSFHDQEGGTYRLLLGRQGEGQWVSVSEVPPGYYFEPHYHDADQFQVIIAGSATMAGEPMSPGTVHYTDKGTPYGPIVAGPEGLTMMVIRPYAEAKAKRIPVADVLDKVRAAQRHQQPES